MNPPIDSNCHNDNDDDTDTDGDDDDQIDNTDAVQLFC